MVPNSCGEPRPISNDTADRAPLADPTGLAGHVVGWILGRRSSNVRRNRWAVELLEVQPTERVIELGCGPGVAVAALADRATRGLVVGVDQSEVVIGQARRRNADAIRQGGSVSSTRRSSACR